MKSSTIREKFLAYFEKRTHTRVKSSSLVPANDPTLFFTNAGMVQFKEIFLGEEKRAYRRACSSQKCMRVSGKHNDLENVGHTPRHHTFFEMLGNFSFGDYFKKDAIVYAWEFLTREVGLDPEKMYVTVFREDDEAEKIWSKHIPKNHIFRLDEKDNFWSMGETGPCGPCSEIIWDFGSGPVKKEDLDADRFMEIWNLVFMQFNRTADGSLSKLVAPSIDTGMGLERLAAVLQGVNSNWETDLFVPLIDKAAQIVGCEKNDPESLTALRVIADHIRCGVFLISDGVIPSNEGRGYVLRRIIRRAIRYGKKLGRNEPFLTDMVPSVVELMGVAYPELAVHQHFVSRVIESEDKRFFATLDRGLELLQAEMGKSPQKIISGELAFQLYDTFGFPLDVTQQIASETGFSVDEEGFNKLMGKQRERARLSWKGSGEEGVSSIYKELVSGGVRTDFVGYTEQTDEGVVKAILKDGGLVGEVGKGSEIGFVTDRTPFYGESGGQVGDSGVAIADGLEIEVSETKRPLPNLLVHYGKVKDGNLKKGTKLTLAIDAERRQQIACNHTATHLLHKALREVLGEHVKQAGSLVEQKRFRFDFSHFQAVTHDELREIEHLVNDAIRKNYPVITYELAYEEAIAHGALAFFGEKYSERVRLIDASGFSKELCGGTHVTATGEIGMLKILSESSVAAGVRRIEAVTGISVSKYVESLENELAKAASILKTKIPEVVSRLEKVVEDAGRMESELAKLKRATAVGKSGDLLEKVEDINGVKIIAQRVEAPDRKFLSEWAEKYRDKLGSAIVALAAIYDDRPAFVVAVSKDLVGRFKAGEIVAAMSLVVGGKGGGRPDFAQGGGSDAGKLDEALKKVSEIIRSK